MPDPDSALGLQVSANLVRAEIVQRADRDLEGTRDAGKLLIGMDQVLADVRIDLIEIGEIPPEQLEGLLSGHARLRALARRLAFGPDAGDGPDSPDGPGIESSRVTPAG